MQVIHGPTGMPFEFPDNTPEPEIQNFFRQAETQMPTPERPVAQQFAQGILDFQQQQQPLTPPQAPINGRGFIGMTPQQAQFHLQQRQNQQALEQRGAIEQLRARQEEQRLNQQSIENEKDRSFRIKEFQSRLKNQQNIAKIEAQLREQEMKQDALSEEDRREFERELEELRQGGREDLLEQRLKGNEQIARIRASGRGGGGSSGADWKEVEIIVDGVPTAGWSNRVTGEFRPIGEAPQGGRGGEEVTLQELRAVQNIRSQIDEAMAISGPDQPDWIPPEERNKVAVQRHNELKRMLSGNTAQPAPDEGTAQPTVEQSVAATTYTMETGKPLKWSPKRGRYVYAK